MTDPSNNGPAWARKAQAKTKWGPGIAIIVVVLIGVRALAFLGGFAGHAGHAPEASTGIRYGGFGAPSREQTATFMNTLDNTLDADSKNFDREAKGAVTVGSLSPEALFRPGGIVGAESALKREREVVAKYEALAAQRKADGRVKLASLYTDSSARQESLAEFDTEVAASDVTMNQYWQLQYGIVDREESLVTFLSRARGLWRPAGGKVMFLSPSLRVAYQRDVDDLRATSAQIKVLIAQINSQNEQARAARRAKLGA